MPRYGWRLRDASMAFRDVSREIQNLAEFCGVQDVTSGLVLCSLVRCCSGKSRCDSISASVPDAAIDRTGPGTTATTSWPGFATGSSPRRGSSAPALVTPCTTLALCRAAAGSERHAYPRSLATEPIRPTARRPRIEFRVLRLGDEPDAVKVFFKRIIGPPVDPEP